MSFVRNVRFHFCTNCPYTKCRVFGYCTKCRLYELSWCRNLYFNPFPTPSPHMRIWFSKASVIVFLQCMFSFTLDSTNHDEECPNCGCPNSGCPNCGCPNCGFQNCEDKHASCHSSTEPHEDKDHAKSNKKKKARKNKRPRSKSCKNC